MILPDLNRNLWWRDTCHTGTYFNGYSDAPWRQLLLQYRYSDDYYCIQNLLSPEFVLLNDFFCSCIHVFPLIIVDDFDPPPPPPHDSWPSNINTVNPSVFMGHSDACKDILWWNDILWWESIFWSISQMTFYCFFIYLFTYTCITHQITVPIFGDTPYSRYENIRCQASVPTRPMRDHSDLRRHTHGKLNSSAEPWQLKLDARHFHITITP